MKFFLTIILVTSQSFVHGIGLRGTIKATLDALNPNVLRQLSEDYYLSSELIDHEHDGDPSYDFVEIIDRIEPHDRVDPEAYQPFKLITDLIGRYGGFLPEYEASEAYEIQVDDQYDGTDGGERGGKVDADFLQYMGGDESDGVPIIREEYATGYDIFQYLGS